MAGGAVVFNLPGVDELKLPREVYCGIVTGKITRWNDAQLVAANPGKTLPDKPITFAHRSNGSGTTFIFTNHMNHIKTVESRHHRLRGVCLRQAQQPLARTRMPESGL
ncbi:substrate-binding domain-containing protein [Thermosynechococcus sp. M55_K2018_012]|uniref:substrate-binding domain-containing protein n=1 Tax=Thermosynechococcus sp. M55_K2018_012 TaxID=2747809 RepID=UPI00345CDCA8